MNVVIRADGSTKMGYGHLTRSNSIATALLDQGKSVTYLSKTPDAVTAVCTDQVEIVRLSSGTPEEVSRKLHDIGADVAYIDLPDTPFELQRAMRTVCPLGIFLGSARHRLCCDLLVNGHFFAEEEQYEWGGTEPIWCLGPDYLPLRQPFPKMTTRETDCSEPPEQGIILMGGTDPHNITPRVMNAFQPLEIPVTVIVGPGNKNEPEILDRKDTLGDNFSIDRNPDDLAERMFEADIAVSGFGTTTYELMATRTPFIGVTRTPSEQQTADRVSDYVAVDYAAEDFDQTTLTSKLMDLHDDAQKRAELQHQFEETIDGNGTERIAEKLRSLIH